MDPYTIASVVGILWFATVLGGIVIGTIFAPGGDKTRRQ